jgi:hypothetical protein
VLGFIKRQQFFKMLCLIASSTVIKTDLLRKLLLFPLLPFLRHFAAICVNLANLAIYTVIYSKNGKRKIAKLPQ